eukprot:8262_1
MVIVSNDWRGRPSEVDGPGRFASARNPRKRQKLSDGSGSDNENDTQEMLQITQGPPEYAYVGTFFRVCLALGGDSNEFNKEKFSKMPVAVELLYGVSEDPVKNQRILEISPDTPSEFGSERALTLVLRVNELTLEHSRAFCLRFSFLQSCDGDLQSVRSIPFFVVSHRLRVTCQPPPLWFNAEGGRYNFIEVRGVLESQAGRRVTGRELGLTVKLLYDDDKTEVNDSRILKLDSLRDRKVNALGEFVVRLRIDQVSKNHRNQPFCIRVAPELPEGLDVASAVCSPVTVKSKRPKPKPVSPSSGQMNGRIEPKVEHKGGVSANLPNLILPRVSPAPAPVRTVAGLSMPPSFERLNFSRNVPVGVNLSKWAQFTSQGLRAMEWAFAGYEFGPGGSMDTRRPLYRCSFCCAYRDAVHTGEHKDNCMIQQALTAYDSLSLMTFPVSTDQRFSDSMNTSPRMDDSHALKTDVRGDNSPTMLDAPVNPLETMKFDPLKHLSSPANSLLRRPSLEQSVSIPTFGSFGALSEFMLPPAQLTNGDIAQTGFNSGSQLNSDHGTLEQVVVISCDLTPRGFPAFDRASRCVGFVQHDQKCAPTFTRFVSVSAQERNSPEIRAITYAFCMRPRSEMITREEYVDADHMMEQVMLNFFDLQAKQVNANPAIYIR